MAAKNNSLLDRFAPIMLVAIVGMAFGMGILWQKVQNLEKTPVTAGTAIQQTAQQPAAVTVTQDQVKSIWDQAVVKFGDKENKLLLVEVADPSCPYCSIAAGKNPTLNTQAGSQFTLVSDGGSYVAPVEEMRKLVDSGQASYAYVYFPGHGSGEMGMKALYCAHEQGKFWQAHDLVMSSQGYDLVNTTVKNDKTKSQEVADFLKSATDATKLKACLDSGKYDSALTSETTLAQSLGVSGTPGFFVNTVSFAGAYSWNDMKATVEAALN